MDPSQNPDTDSPPDSLPELGAEEFLRYSRHLVLPEVGEEGQRRLKGASVLLVGAGGLGSPLALYLAAAGVGRIGLVEFDTVDLSNLQRQVLYETADVGRSKLDAARKRILSINPAVEVEAHGVRLSTGNALRILAGYDVIADGTDNFPTRYLVNDACVLLGKPNVYGSVFRFEGQASVFHAGVGPCYRCLFPEPPPPGSVPSCAEGGVLGILPGLIGLIQATEAVKLLLGKGRSLVGRLLLYDALNMEFRELRVARNPDCPICGRNPTLRELIEYEQLCRVTDESQRTESGEAMRVRETEPAAGTAAGGRGPAEETRIPVAPAPPQAPSPSLPPPGPLDPARLELSPREVRRRLSGNESLTLLDIREEAEVRFCALPGSVWIPMGQLPARLHELSKDRAIIVYCHVGVRSYQVTRFLRALGYSLAFNMEGGIDAWAREVDSTLQRY